MRSIKPPIDKSPPDGQDVPRRIWSGTALQITGRIFGSGCTFASLWLCARYLPIEEFGRYTFYLALFGVLDALADFGTGQAAIRLTANEPRALLPVLRQARKARLFSSTLGVLLIVLFTELFDEPGRGWIIMAALYPVTHTLELTSTVFKNEIAWRIPVVIRAFASALRLVLVAALLFYGTDSAPQVLFATAVASASANLLLHFVSRRKLDHRAEQITPSASLLRTSFPLGLGSLCAIAYFYVDNLFIRSLEGEVELAHYNAGVRLLSFLIMTAQLASSTALPWLIRRFEEGKLAAAIANLGQPLFAAAGLVCGLLTPWSDRILSLVFTEAFAAGAPSFRWLLGAAAIIHVGAIFVTALIVTGQQNRFMVVAALGLALNVIGNALLVPSLGIEGAAISTLATELLVCVLSLVVLVRTGCRPLSVKPMGWLAGLGTYALGFALSSIALA